MSRLSDEEIRALIIEKVFLGPNGKDALIPFARAIENAAYNRAATVCDEEGNEWDSDDLITEKNYAHACRDRIRKLKEGA